LRRFVPPDRPRAEIADPGGHLMREVVLDGAGARRRGRLLVAMRPHMGSGACIDDLRRHADLVGDAPHAALDDIFRPELAADLRHVHGLALVDKGRVAGGHVIDPEGAEVGDQLFAEAIGEGVQGRITGKVVEGKHGDGRAARAGPSRSGGLGRREAGDAVTMKDQPSGDAREDEERRKRAAPARPLSSRTGRSGAVRRRGRILGRRRQARNRLAPQPMDAHRTRDVPDLLLAAILERKVEPPSPGRGRRECSDRPLRAAQL
jgi:hypothetical protein